MSFIRKFLAMIPESRDKTGANKKEGRNNKRQSGLWSKLSFLWVILPILYIVYDERSTVLSFEYYKQSPDFHNMTCSVKIWKCRKDIGKEKYISTVLHSIAV